MKTTLLRACSAVAVVLAAVSPLRAGGDAVAAPRAVASCRTGGITIPRVLSFQGKLTDTVGLPVADTLHVVRFKLYAQPTGGTHFWEEIQSVTTRKGQFSVLLGLLRPLGSLPESGGAYLGMAVGGGPEMTPRLRLASAAYAYLSERAGTAEQLQGKDTAALDRRYVNEAQAGAVTGVMIADGAIGAKDLGQMGASIGQVMKWTGSAWAARNDSASRGFDSTAFHHNDTTDEGQIGGEKHLFATAAHFRHKTPEDPLWTHSDNVMG